jgi:PKD repeat protein
MVTFHMFRYSRVITVVLASLSVVLIFSTWRPGLSAPSSPMNNPDFWDKLSGVVVINPSWPVAPLYQNLGQLHTFTDLVDVLGDVPLGPNVLCNQDPTTAAQNEPSIAVNPSDPNHIIAAANDYRLLADPSAEHDVRAGYYVSFDGGNSWPGDGIIDISTIPDASAAGDPAIAIHDIHNVYFSYITFSRSSIAGGVAVSKSNDGGLTWLAPVVVAWNSATEFQDKEYLAVDTTGSIFDGNVYITWTRFANDAPIYFSRSTDGGVTFSDPFQISDPSYDSNQGSLPVVGPDGVIYVAWLNFDTGSIRMVKSTNGGQSFGDPFPVADITQIPSPLPGGGFRDNSFPTMAVDPVNGNIFIAWSDFRNGDADIYFTRSTNGGSTWSEAVRINDDLFGSNAHQFFPWLSVAPDGKLFAGWYDSRLDPTPLSEPLLYDEFVTASTDGGITFSPNQRTSEVTADSSIGGFSTPFIGDYSGLAATNNFVYPAWVDTRHNQEDIYTQRIYAIQGQKDAPPWIKSFKSFNYSISLNSHDSVSNIQVNDPIPAETTFVPGSAFASSGLVSYSEGTLTWDGDLSPNVPISITFTVTPITLSCRAITNNALLTTDQGVDITLSATSIITGPPPVPEFFWDSSDLVFTFTNETSGGSPLDYVWDFGDGITSTALSPVHAYALPGDYTVRLNAGDLCGTAGITHPVVAACSPPQAGFIWLDQGLSVTFTNQSIGRFPLSILWDFGDGSSSTDPSPTHLYASLGRYLVHLTITDLCGTSDFNAIVSVGQFIFLPLTNR